MAKMLEVRTEHRTHLINVGRVTSVAAVSDWGGKVGDNRVEVIFSVSDYLVFTGAIASAVWAWFYANNEIAYPLWQEDGHGPRQEED
jgi:hypothetical protein